MASILHVLVWRRVGSLTETSQSLDTVLLFLHNTELSIHELAVYHPPSTARNGSLHALGELQKCLRAVEKWLQVFLAIPPSTYHSITFEVLGQLTHQLMVQRTLLSIDDPLWDKAEVRRQVDLFGILDRVAANFRAVPGAVGIVEDSLDEGIWRRGEKLIKFMAANWRAELEGDQTGVVAAPAADGDNGAGSAPVVDGEVAAGFVSDPNLRMEDVLMGFGDDPWLSEGFVSWDPMA